MKHLPILVVLGLALGQCLATEIVANPTKKKGAGSLFQIRRGKLWGYMDRTGKVAIRPQFVTESDFLEGMAAVSKGEECGYINERGQVLISYHFDGCGDFREGLAPVRVGRRWGYIDKVGRFVAKPQFQGA